MPRLPTDRVMYILIDGNNDERAEVIEQLRATAKTHDHSEIRDRIVRDLTERFNASDNVDEALAQRDPNLTPSIRSWMLSALSIVMDKDSHARKLLLSHLDPSIEPDEGVRYWTLAGLYNTGLPELESRVHELYESEKSDKVKTLAAAILSEKNPQMTGVLNDLLSRDDYPEVHRALRALRIVAIDSLIPSLVDLLERGIKGPVAYDTLYALAQVRSRKQAAALIQKRYRPEQIIDKFLEACRGSSRTAIKRISMVFSEMDLAPLRPLLDNASKNSNFAISKAALDLIQAIGEQQEGWIEFPLAGGVSDSVEGTDQLDIMRDVKTLCAVLIAKQVKPPLAVGLFGDWGTGKTFFMEKMRSEINDIVRRATKYRGETKFHTQVIQISFNAWHYSDANLWASMVSYIFEKLAMAVSPGESAEDAKARLFKELQTAKELKEEAEFARQNAITQRDETENLLRSLAEKRAEKEVEIADLKFPDLMALINSDKDLKTKIDNSLNSLGFPAAMNSLQDLESAFSEAHTLGGRLRATFLQIVKSKSRYALIALLLASLLLLPLLAWAFKSWLPNQPFVAHLATFVGDFALFIVGLVASMKDPLKKASGYLTTLESAHKKVNEILTEKRKEKSDKELQLEKDLNKIKAEEAAASKRFIDAETKVREIEDKIKELDDGRNLSKFLLDRVQSEDYRKHLGIISSIRKDFEKLSELLPQGAIDEAKRVLNPIDRIILYIDDLDRCSSVKVVEVLQAVHLLLAFPLFVVVVGVDSRWLLHSLEETYSAFHDNGNPMLINGNQSSAWMTTPQNYLEKIFQIPFALRPMPRKGYIRLMQHLIPSTAGIDSTDQINRLGDPPHSVPTPSEPSMQSSETESVPASSVRPALKQEIEQGEGESKHGPVVKTEVLEVDGDKDLNPRSLDIQPWETSYAENLYGLIPTPRAAKRFSNVYRILKASVPATELAKFEGNALQPGEFRAVMILLGLLTGYPREATTLISLLYKSKDISSIDFFNNIDSTLQQSGFDTQNVQRLTERVKELIEKGFVPESIEPFIRWSPRVARFSFEAAKTILPE
jgi:hypothetical protein